MPSLFSPPGRVGDLTRPADLQRWSDLVSGQLDARISPGSQLFNPLTHPRADVQPRRIPWLAVPQTVWDYRPRDVARAHNDDPANRQDSGIGQNEYAEWFTRRDPDGQVVCVDVTTEVPEYWTLLGQVLSRRELGDIYRQLYPAALDDELYHPGPTGAYNPLNRWNTRDGAMHLIGQINTLPLAVGVVAGGVPWRFDAAGQVVDAQDCGMGGFHADPALGANVNRVAREGRAITFQDPVGIYIVDVDTSGWETPDGSSPAGLVTLGRGTPPMHARVVVPPGRGFRLCDVRIAGEPVRWGSQVAERVVVGVVLSVGPAGEFTFTTGQVCAGALAAPASPPAPGMMMAGAEAAFSMAEAGAGPAAAPPEGFQPFVPIGRRIP